MSFKNVINNNNKMSNSILELNTNVLMNYINNKIKEFKTPGIVVFDVDECLLWNLKDGRVIRRVSVGKLYDTFSNEGWKIYICTARDNTESSYKYLKNQLDELNYDNNASIFLRPRDLETGKYKYMTRKKISKENNKMITFMFGDQFTDVWSEGEQAASENIQKPKTGVSYLIRSPDKYTNIGIKLSEYSSFNKKDV